MVSIFYVTYIQFRPSRAGTIPNKPKNLIALLGMNLDTDSKAGFTEIAVVFTVPVDVVYSDTMTVVPQRIKQEFYHAYSLSRRNICYTDNATHLYY